jgi:hypothetical protein
MLGSREASKGTSRPIHYGCLNLEASQHEGIFRNVLDIEIMVVYLESSLKPHKVIEFWLSCQHRNPSLGRFRSAEQCLPKRRKVKKSVY